MTNEKTGIRKIAYNCRKATLLIEKKHTDGINMREKLELKIHLAGCNVCKTFEKQSILINNMVKKLIDDSRLSDVKLADDVKEEMQQKIDSRINSSK